jgi:2-amino-4-hydroxy-6-hydroxymethyldihydropteridine diphosphokinase
MNQIVVSLGSNIDKERNLPEAVRWLSRHCRLLAVSNVYETCPVGLEDQPTFLNAAVLLESELDAAAFRLEILAPLERALHRVRTADKNAPRTIDADLTLFNDAVFDLDADHPIPDPDLLQAAHVAVPVAEIVPDMHHPETGELLAGIAQRLRLESISGDKPALWERPDIELPKNPRS